ncbi:O-antigen ligase family protein [Rugamonas rubra]|uniref:O-antigen ligase n=1 Tax=Rugamonas rubra TaxID=758825 RepID=A0A1I4I521_9BURK|nr:O-antigen ligase family protein [Rugamonas rubra]SFL49217.1 O-antigen ligase [Rugamonas rubra]
MNHTLSGPARGNSLLIHLLLFCLPFLTLISSFGVGLCSFAFLLAAVLTRRDGMAALRRHWPQVRGVLLAFGLGLAFAVLLMVLRHGVHLRALEKPGRMLAAATVMLAVLACRPSRRALWWGLIAGAVAGAAFSVYQRWGMGMQRPGGLINSITFGDIVLCMGLMCLAASSDFKGRLALWPAFGALAGLAGSIATGTRGGWLAVLFAGVLMVRYGHVLRGRLRQGAALAALALLLASYFVPQTGARQRLEQGIDDVRSYYGGGNAYSNMGVRLELWRGAAMLIERHPLSGAAAPQVKAELAELAADGKIDPFVLQFDHFHNDMVQALVYGGVLGLLAWGATLLLPLLFFLRILRRRPTVAAGLLAPALAGALLVVCYFSFGLTEVIFWSVRSTMFYALMLFLLMGLCLNAQDEAAAAAAPADKAAA